MALKLTRAYRLRPFRWVPKPNRYVLFASYALQEGRLPPFNKLDKLGFCGGVAQW
jgi:hypothetical protein